MSPPTDKLVGFDIPSLPGIVTIAIGIYSEPAEFFDRAGFQKKERERCRALSEKVVADP
jgi:hypothetical protein